MPPRGPLEGSFRSSLRRSSGRPLGGVVGSWLRVVGDLLEGSCGSSLRRFWETSRRGRGGNPPSGPRGRSHTSAEGAFWRASRAMNRHPFERSWRRSPRAPRGVRRSLRLGPSRSPALDRSGGPSSGRRGSRRAPSRACEEHHQGRPLVPSSDTSCAVAPGRSPGRAKAMVGAAVERADLGLRTSSRVFSSVESAGCHWAVLRPSQDLRRTRRTGSAPGRATLCDTRLKDATQARRARDMHMADERRRARS
jgi:hypothetical protein